MPSTWSDGPWPGDTIGEMIGQYKEIIVALIAVFGAVIPYLLQRNKEMNLKIADQKRDAYAAFLRNYTSVAIAVMHDEEVTGKKWDKDRLQARDQLLLYGSDEVIAAYDAWVSHDSESPGGLDKEGQLMTLLLLAIRKDLLGRTRVTAAQVDNMNPFNRG
jgi:hypothetical protein